MDDRRLSTEDFLSMGMINIPAPKTDIPKDRETLDAETDSFSYIGDEAVAVALDEGKVVSASNYYGIPNAWKESDGVYRGTLLQYRAVTEDETFDSSEAAAEWFGKMYGKTYG